MLNKTKMITIDDLKLAAQVGSDERFIELLEIYIKQQISDRYENQVCNGCGQNPN